MQCVQVQVQGGQEEWRRGSQEGRMVYGLFYEVGGKVKMEFVTEIVKLAADGFALGVGMTIGIVIVLKFLGEWDRARLKILGV